VIGPRENHDRVIMRSEGAGLDLLGYAIRTGLEDRREYRPAAFDAVFSASLTMALFSRKGRRLNTITSLKVVKTGPEDERNSSCVFAWVGESSSPNKDKIETIFNNHIVDLKEAIDSDDLEGAEWHIAPVLYECIKGQQSRSSYRAFLRVYVLALVVSALVAFVVYMVRLFTWVRMK
jgi:hypothetical protein